MIIDAILLLLIVLTAFLYWRKGFIPTVVSFCQWVGSMILAFMFFGRLREFIEAETDIDEQLIEYFAAKFDAGFSQSAGFGLLPKTLSELAGTITEQASVAAAEGLVRMILSVAAFFLILLSVKFFAYLIGRPFRKKKKGPLKIIDRAAGGILGIIIGMIYCLLVLALLPVITGILPENAAAALEKDMSESTFSEVLYLQNPLLLLIQGF